MNQNSGLTTNTVNRWGDAGGDILADMKRAIAELQEVPPPPFLASYTLFPEDRAIHFKRVGRDYVGAHPNFWKKFPEAAAPFHGSMIRIEIFDLDASETHRRAFAEAMAATA